MRTYVLGPRLTLSAHAYVIGGISGALSNVKKKEKINSL